ncbi:hypothetical protein ABZT47_35570 [Sphaerisporangium sp. NPDC005289]|uniref:hypothetical protein n=1 Tax=Sphaerisporangium sp. NPDC005289 TaxID=3155247 RepID=UPI0033A6F443
MLPAAGPPSIAGHSLARRVLAGLFGVTLPARDATADPAVTPPRLESDADPDGLVVIFKRLQPSAAHTADEPRPMQAAWDLGNGTTVRCHNRPGMDQVEISLVTTRPDWRDTLLPVRVTGTDYLMLIGATEGAAEGRVIARTRAVDVRIEFRPPARPPSSLKTADIEVVRRSVRGSSQAGMNLWRRIARKRVEGDPLRTAITEALP